MARNPIPLKKLISRQAPLRRWVENARAQSLLLEELAEQLPPAIRSHCLGARLDGDTLVVLADSAAWATRLRYALPSILARHGARKCRVRVMPLEQRRPKTVRKRPQLPPEAARLLAQTAESTEDPDLAAVLRRLAAHGEKNG